jgi:deazaflavin-dependent oxidoreductase (nitroreductase family)
MLPNRLRFFNKYVTNRILQVFAHASWGPFAMVRHIGRRSGKSYETVLMVWPQGEHFVIALTYGPNVDWYQNLLAAGGGSVYWHKRLYKIGKPEPIDAEAVLPLFPTPFRQILRSQKIKHFVQVSATAAE